MEKINKLFVVDSITSLSSTENMGADRVLSFSKMKSSILASITEEVGPHENFDFGKIIIKETASLHLDDETVPTINYRFYFEDLHLLLNIEAKHFFDWYYYVDSLVDLDELKEVAL